MSATTIRTDIDATRAGVPPAPPEAHQQAGDLKVRLQFGTGSVYACIRTSTRDTDVLVRSGRTAVADLRQAAVEIRENARRASERAELIERAADVLAQDPGRAIYGADA